MENKVLETFEDGRIAWINELMQKCGVISSEQPVQEHTRIVTDAKKREYPFHKVDRPGTISKKRLGEAGPNDYLKLLDLRPASSFFIGRFARFIANMDSDDYRCKVVKHGMVKELVIFQKGYMKYLTDNYRLNRRHSDRRYHPVRPGCDQFPGGSRKADFFPADRVFRYTGAEREHQDDRYAVETEGRLFRGCQETTSDGDQ